MWFDKLDDIESLAQKRGATIFVVPLREKISIRGAIVLQPEEKTVITIDQVRSVLKKTELKAISDLFVIIRPAEKLGLDAANALLKNLEEPGAKIHYILITESPAEILPTILSRANLYFWRDGRKFSLGIDASEKAKAVAKRLVSAGGADLVQVAEEITKKKAGVREYTLSVLELAIEMMEKSYFLTGKEMFLNKLVKLLKAYDGLRANGNLKLQIVANLC